MKASFFACTESAVLDANSNRISLFHLLEDLSVVNVPIMLPGLTAVTFLEKESGDKDAS